MTKIRISERLWAVVMGFCLLLTTVTGCQKAEQARTQNTASVEKKSFQLTPTRSPVELRSGAIERLTRRASGVEAESRFAG